MRRNLAFLLLLGIASGAATHATQQVAARPTAEVQKNDSGMFQPRRHTPVSFRDNEGKLTITSGGEQLYVSVENTGTPPRSIKLPEDLLQANEIRRVNTNRAVVLGMENGDVFYVAILDLLSLNVSDRFACYFPSLSPDGHYISFVKFSVAHPDRPVEDHYMLYDLTKSASENRPKGVSARDWMTVGTTIYPVGIGNKPLDNYGREDHATAVTKFFWSPYNNTVLFADRSHDVLSVVLASIGSEGNTRVRRVDLTLSEICSKAQSARRNTCLVNLTSAKFDEDPTGGVEIVISGVGADVSILPQNYKFKYSQFT